MHYMAEPIVLHEVFASLYIDFGQLPKLTLSNDYIS